MKKVLCILGSPRKNGNSAAIAGKFVTTAQEMGAEVTTFVLNDMVYKGCQGCMACKTVSETCVVQDDLTQVLTALADADVIVMTSPIYFGEVTGQLKCFFDRLYSLLKPDFYTNPNALRLAPGKKAVLIMTQGDPDESHFDVAPHYTAFFNRYGIETRIIRGIGMNDPNAAAGNPAIMKQAEDAARAFLA
jgi:multimeric flavodoxin WrbA